MSKFFITLYSTFVFLFFAISCKKYPENTLWFSKPEKKIEGDWTLEKYEVNGIDSTHFEDLKMYREHTIIFRVTDPKDLDLGGSFKSFEQFEYGGWRLTKKKKHILIKHVRATSGGVYTKQKNLFINDDFLEWKIEKLTNRQFWISVNHNNIQYEVHLKRNN